LAADVIEDLAQIDIDDDRAERPALRVMDRCRGPYDRNLWQDDAASVLLQLDRRDIDPAGPESNRALEVVASALLAQLINRRDADGTSGSMPIDAQQLLSAGIHADDAEFRIGRLCGKLCDKARRKAIAPLVGGRAVARINAA